jgi:acyl carrier protein
VLYSPHMDQKVIELISEHFGMPTAEITPNLELRGDFNATELEIADFFSILEKTFSIAIPREDSQDLLTVSDITSYIQDNADDELSNN